LGKTIIEQKRLGEIGRADTRASETKNLKYIFGVIGELS
jgi:hypothetical protein